MIIGYSYKFIGLKVMKRRKDIRDICLKMCNNGEIVVYTYFIYYARFTTNKIKKGRV